MNRAIFLASFRSTQFKGSKSFTSPAIRQLKSVASNAVIGPIPLRLANTPLHVSSVPMPTGDKRPTPETTTRRKEDLASLLSSVIQRTRGALLLGLLRVDVVDCILHGDNLLCVL